ncbi:exported hypothetical protein [Parafrankia sp. Ea1.12]|nr:exported hypothetical protein [Parafrankia sp. Ea1.12]
MILESVRPLCAHLLLRRASAAAARGVPDMAGRPGAPTCGRGGMTLAACVVEVSAPRRESAS